MYSVNIQTRINGKAVEVFGTVFHLFVPRKDRLAFNDFEIVSVQSAYNIAFKSLSPMAKH